MASEKLSQKLSFSALVFFSVCLSRPLSLEIIYSIILAFGSDRQAAHPKHLESCANQYGAFNPGLGPSEHDLRTQDGKRYSPLVQGTVFEMQISTIRGADTVHSSWINSHLPRCDPLREKRKRNETWRSWHSDLLVEAAPHHTHTLTHPSSFLLGDKSAHDCRAMGEGMRCGEGHDGGVMYLQRFRSIHELLHLIRVGFHQVHEVRSRQPEAMRVLLGDHGRDLRET